jgi:uncharacterized protein
MSKARSSESSDSEENVENRGNTKRRVSPARSLLNAFEQEDTERVQALLTDFRSDVDVNETDETGMTPLLHAIDWAWVDVIRQLLARGANVHVRDPRGRSVFHRLLNRDDWTTEVDQEAIAIAQILIEAGGDVNATSPLGGIALHGAASLYPCGYTEFLLAHGAEVNHRNEFEMTPLLSVAAWPGRFEGRIELEQSDQRIELLLEYGADIEAVDHLGRNAFALAVEGGADNNIEVLLRHGVNTDCPTLTAKVEPRLRPSLAAVTRNLDALKAALTLRGAHPNVRTDSGRTPLHWAAARDFAEGVRFLLASGANIDATDRNNISVARLAVESGSAEAVRELLAHTPRFRNATIEFGVAAIRGNQEMVSAFLEANVPVRYGSAGPHWRSAALMRRADLLRALYAFRGKIEAEGYPLQLWHAVAVSDREIAEVLLNEMKPSRNEHPRAKQERLEELGEALRVASTNGRLDFMTWLLGAGAPVNGYDPIGSTALMCAAGSGHLEAVQLLLASGADPTYQDTSGQTAIGWAMAEGHAEIAALLRKAVSRLDTAAL